MFETILLVALFLIALSILASLVRIVKGPSMPDRVIALDTIGINLIAAAAIICMMLGTQAFLEVILLIGILAFIGTIAFSKFLERGVVIERNRDQ